MENISEITVYNPNEIEVEQWPSFSEEEIVTGEGTHFGKVLYRDETKLLSNGIWDCPPSTFVRDYGPMTESIHCVKGHATITDLKSGKSFDLRPGDYAILPVGTRVKWEVHEHFRKTYAIYEATWDEERYY